MAYEAKMDDKYREIMMANLIFVAIFLIVVLTAVVIALLPVGPISQMIIAVAVSIVYGNIIVAIFG